MQYSATLPSHPSNNWGERSEPHTCGVNGKLSVYWGEPERPHTSESNGAIFIYYWGERSEPHTCGVNEKLSVYIYIYLFIYIYIYGTYVFRIYTSCPICARCNISTLHVGSCNYCCPREKTSRTERLNSGKQRTET